jgi:malate dehydrogenase (oxaloacetate-decarboxylating)
MDYYAESIRLHKEKQGKLETISKVPLNDKNDLSISYSP